VGRRVAACPGGCLVWRESKPIAAGGSSAGWWSVASVALGVEGVAGGGGPVEVLVVGGGHDPSLAVGDAVMVAAQQSQVGEVGVAIVFPVGDVVGVAP
jgi:hypothetical protein